MDTSIALPPQQYFGSDQYAVCNNFELEKGRDISVLDIRVSSTPWTARIPCPVRMK